MAIASHKSFHKLLDELASKDLICGASMIDPNILIATHYGALNKHHSAKACKLPSFRP
jgi:hypothetical protein